MFWTEDEWEEIGRSTSEIVIRATEYLRRQGYAANIHNSGSQAEIRLHIDGKIFPSGLAHNKVRNIRKTWVNVGMSRHAAMVRGILREAFVAASLPRPPSTPPPPSPQIMENGWLKCRVLCAATKAWSFSDISSPGRWDERFFLKVERDEELVLRHYGHGLNAGWSYCSSRSGSGWIPNDAYENTL